MNAGSTLGGDVEIGQSGILDLLAYLVPLRAVGYEKIRLGSAYDGGYVMLDDFDGLSEALSLGIGGNDEWDLDVARRGIMVDQFDDSVDGAPSSHQDLRFHPKRITPHAAEECVTFASLLSGETRDVMVKMDIEGAEWDVLDVTDRMSLARCRQICVEFHSLGRLTERGFYRRALRVFKRLSTTHAAVHVHANNFGQLLSVNNIPLPDVLEISFASRGRYEFADSNETFPGPLDAPNHGGRPDIRLGCFRF